MFGKNLTSKNTKNKISVDSEFSNELYGRKQKPENVRNQQKAF